MTRPVPTLAEILGWPATVDVPTAATAYGISKSWAHELIARGQFPAQVLRLGENRVRVITASIVETLGGAA